MQLMIARRARRRARPGFTLVELLVTMTMLSIIGAAVVGVFSRQQRFARAAADVGALRTQLQTAAILLPSELRGISAVGGDILRMSDSSLNVRATIATSVICAIAGNTITLAPAGPLASPVPAAVAPAGTTTDVIMTSVLLAPVPGDSAFVWNESVGRWIKAGSGTPGRPYPILDVATTDGACPSVLGMTAPVDAPAIQLTLDQDMSAFTIGAPVQVVRNVAYGLYRSTVDGQWYLGYRDRSLTQYEYVAGPFRPYASGSTTSGLLLTYYNTLGARLAVGSAPIDVYAQTSQVGRVEILANATSTDVSSLAGSSTGKVQQDWLRVGIAIRNRTP